MAKTILITGGSGLLGVNWACYARSMYDVVLGTHTRPVRLSGVRTVELPCDDVQKLSRQIDLLSADIVVHAAAMTDVEGCERQPVLAAEVNTGIARNVAEAVSQCGRRLVHISTDHLFDGSKTFCDEAELPRPLNQYAATKLAAEVAVLHACPTALVVRTNFFGWGTGVRRSFSDWIIDSLRAGRGLNLFDDVYFTPILADVLADTIHDLLDVEASGVFNVTGDERLSKHAFGHLVARKFRLPADLISAVSSKSMPLTTRRPADMSLCNAKVVELLGRKLGGVEEYLDQLALQESDGRAEELIRAVA